MHDLQRVQVGHGLQDLPHHVARVSFRVVALVQDPVKHLPPRGPEGHQPLSPAWAGPGVGQEHLGRLPTPGSWLGKAQRPGPEGPRRGAPWQRRMGEPWDPRPTLTAPGR